MKCAFCWLFAGVCTLSCSPRLTCPLRWESTWEIGKRKQTRQTNGQCDIWIYIVHESIKSITFYWYAGTSTKNQLESLKHAVFCRPLSNPSFWRRSCWRKLLNIGAANTLLLMYWSYQWSFHEDFLLGHMCTYDLSNKKEDIAIWSIIARIALSSWRANDPKRIAAPKTSGSQTPRTTVPIRSAPEEKLLGQAWQPSHAKTQKARRVLTHEKKNKKTWTRSKVSKVNKGDQWNLVRCIGISTQTFRKYHCCEVEAPCGADLKQSCCQVL